MHTGDLAVMDGDGYVAITGRIKDMIIRGGENISPREIEEFLHTHEKVSDVQVIGVPDHKYGEEVCAWIRLRDGVTATTEEFRDFCRGQIATYKIPRYVRFASEFPMTVTGNSEVQDAGDYRGRTGPRPSDRCGADLIQGRARRRQRADKSLVAHTGDCPVRQPRCVCRARVRAPGEPEAALHAHHLGDERAGRRRTGARSGCAAGESWHGTRPLRRSRRYASERRF
jgi:hypothetical protein